MTVQYSTVANISEEQNDCDLSIFAVPEEEFFRSPLLLAKLREEWNGKETDGNPKWAFSSHMSTSLKSLTSLREHR